MVTTEQVTTFMAPAMEEAAKFIQLLDVGGDPAINDAPLKCAADLAYSQVAGFTSRDFVKTTFIDRYFNIPKRVEVRCIPLVSVEEVKYDTTVLVVNQDYQIDGNYLVFGGLGASLFTHGVDETTLSGYLYDELKVSYTAGIENTALNHLLQSALVFQVIANYRRRDVIGLGKVVLAGPAAQSADVSSDKGRIVDAARDILDKLVYYGDYEEC
jgi:hypothetical protein